VNEQTRAVFHEEDIAREVADRLRVQGFAVDVRREPFAGEDDDEDHPWALTTDAPVIMLELIAEEYDGWVDFAEEPASRPAPLDLPGMPKRLHRDT
jgi:hypothetical protein